MPLTQGLEIPYGIQPTNPVPVDSYSGPYTGSPDTEANAIAAANAAIPSAVRFKSMEVRLVIGGVSYKYWYKNGIADGDLVEFIASGISVTSAADNRVLTSTGTVTGIDAESNLTFDGTDLTVTGDINVNGATSADVKTTTTAATVFNQNAITLSIGGAATSLNIGGATGAATTNLSTGAISTGIKTINIGTGGTTGSTTTINIGTSSGGTGTTTVNGNLSITGNTTIGDSSSDTLTINASVLSLSSNLNVGGDALFLDPTNNYVGINNNSPAYTLDVGGKINTQSDVIVGNSTIRAKTLPTACNVFNDSTGNVYIANAANTVEIGSGYTGNTNFKFGANTTNSPSSKSLRLGTGGLAGSTTTVMIGSPNGSTTTVYGNFETAGNTTIGDAVGDTLTINAGTVSVPNGLNFDSGTLYIDASNNRVGIVNSSPSTALDVVGTITASGGLAVNGGNVTTTASTLNVGNTTAGFTANFATGATISGSTKAVNIGTGSAAGSTTNITIGSSLGTCTTIVNGGLSVTGNTTLGDASVDSLTFNASTLSIPNNLNINSNTLYVDATNNRVGIGNAAPTTPLHVTGNATVTGNISVTGDTTLGDASVDSITLNASNASIPNNFNFGSNALYINNTSKSVGVGINSAKAKIDVYGDGLFRTTANSTNGVIYHNPLGDTLGAKVEFGTYGTGDGTNFADYGDVGVYGSKFNINSKGRDISFKINDIERMSLSSSSTYDLTLSGNIRINGNSISSSAGTTNITLNSSTRGFTMYGDLTINPASGASADITSTSATVTDGSIFSGSTSTGTISLGLNAATVTMGSTTGTVKVNNDFSILSGNIIGGLTAATAGGNSAANAVAIPYSALISVLQPAVSAIHYKLPTAVGNTGRILMIKNITQSTYSANVYTSVSGQTVDYKGTHNGAASPVTCFILSNTAASGALNAVTLYSDGSNWFIINSYNSP